MALEKTTEEDKFEVVGPYKTIQVRTATVIKEDGKEISRAFHRKCVTPGSIDDSNNYTKNDLSSESTEVTGIANSVWTQAIHDAYKASLIANKSS